MKWNNCSYAWAYVFNTMIYIYTELYLMRM